MKYYNLVEFFHNFENYFTKLGIIIDKKCINDKIKNVGGLYE